MISPHPITDRYMQMRKERRDSRITSFLAGVMFGVAIFSFWTALSDHTSLPASCFTGITLSSEPAGIDI
jgi:hypothetical protein